MTNALELAAAAGRHRDVVRAEATERQHEQWAFRLSTGTVTVEMEAVALASMSPEILKL